MRQSEMIGQILDEKYRIERELGRGGMGTVYLATHLGTERPVAVKVVKPQYMRRPEFVERFRREARAAGRLRHPNVVDVTDFGFADTENGQVAYLVMEYLDGCTLGEILEEEKNLPVGWTLDIVEQVSSAIQEAHSQNIIHRDLKPDNIWLEPNQRGGYTVKVLDFGIAKLEAAAVSDPRPDGDAIRAAVPTFSGVGVDGTLHDSIAPTITDGAVANVTLDLDPTDGTEKKTAILAPVEDPDSVGTRILPSDDGDENIPYTIRTSEGDPATTANLTKVGAVLGTPLYMSPEQCAGQQLDARSDIYSLGVIAYQMLSGRTPFEGEFTQVMEAHRSAPPPLLKGKKLRRKLRKTIHSALAKDPADRPQSAEAFATILRARSEGIFGLLRRGSMIYTDRLSKFLMLSTFFHVPMIVLTAALLTISLLSATGKISATTDESLKLIIGTSLGLTTALGAYLIIGTTTWIVAQSIALPLKPIRVRESLIEAKRKWKALALTGLLSVLGQTSAGIVAAIAAFAISFVILGLILGFGEMAAIWGLVSAASIGGVVFLSIGVLWTLVPPVVMMENLRGVQAIKRSTQLVRRSLVTAIAAVLIMFFVPAFVATLVSSAISFSAKGIKQSVVHETRNEDGSRNIQLTTGEGEGGDPGGIKVSVGKSDVGIVGMDPETEGKLQHALLEVLMQLVLVPVQILMTSLTSIIVALLYLKTRQAGGETASELVEKFRDTSKPRKKWQERVQRKLIQSGRTSKPT